MALALVVERSCNFAIKYCKYNPLEIYFVISTFFSFNHIQAASLLKLTCKIKILLKFESGYIKAKRLRKIFVHILLKYIIEYNYTFSSIF